MDRLDKQRPHTRPLKNRLGDDGKGNERTDLQTGNRYDRNKGVFECMTEVDHPIGQPPCPGELDIIGQKHLHHFRPNNAKDQGQLIETESNGGKNNRLPAADGQQSGRPRTDDLDCLAPAERGEHAEGHRKQIDEEDADDKSRQGDPGQ